MTEDLELEETRGRPGSCSYCYALCAPCFSCGSVYLGNDEQLLVETTTGKEVINGPLAYFPSPWTVLGYVKRYAISLTSLEYIKVKNDINGDLKIIKGPQMYFLDAYESCEEGKQEARVLGPTAGIVIKDCRTGEERLLKGPTTFIPGPFEESVKTVHAISLNKGQYTKIEDRLTGNIWIERGEKLLWLKPSYRQQGGVEEAYSLKAHQYVRLEDTLTGDIRVERGEKIVFPTAYERPIDRRTARINGVNKVTAVMDAVDLKKWEYCKIMDMSTGKERVERGEKMVWLGPKEKIVGDDKQRGYTVDRNNAVLVKNKDTGDQTLIKKPQLFVPNEDEEIVEIRRVIRLADHQAIVLKDQDGQFHYYYGDPKRGTDRTFFLPPYWEKVTMMWSRGRRREVRDLAITIFDTRPCYMSFEFNCRTSDNVEMILEGTFFWEVVSLPDMIRFTGDASGDVCAHARSCFIQLVSKITLKEFMDSFNEIAHQAHSQDDEFYRKRGIKIHSLMVTRYHCANQSTSKILEQIITETTNRMNRLSRQESENEVALAKLKAEVLQETAKSEVLKIKQQHTVENARAEGAAEAEAANAFLQAVKGTGVKDPLELWKTLRKNEALKSISNGRANVYFTPADANISIESKASSY